MNFIALSPNPTSAAMTLRVRERLYLGDRFYGIGTYSVRLKAHDRLGRKSRAVFRSSTVTD